jgi:hypothetical protein
MPVVVAKTEIACVWQRELLREAEREGGKRVGDGWWRRRDEIRILDVETRACAGRIAGHVAGGRRLIREQPEMSAARQRLLVWRELREIELRDER